MTLEDRLTAATVHLVEEPQNGLFVHRLTRNEVGRWTDLFPLCEGIPARALVQALQEEFGGDLKVTWLSDPDYAQGPDCLKVLFHSKVVNWSNLVTLDTERIREDDLDDELQELHAELTREDELSDIIAELVTTDWNALFLARLFSLEAGQWADLSALCCGLPEGERLDAIRGEFDGDLNVMWRPDPDSAHGPDYCVILTYSAALHWSNLVITSRGHFFEEIAPRLSSAW